MPYSLALLSPIPVLRRGAQFSTLDLWARDLAAQVDVVGALLLLAPVAEWTDAHGRDGVAREAVPDGVRLVDPETLDDAALRAELAGVDVVQLPGNDDWRGARAARRVLRAARRARRPVVVGISSNRAKTARLNAAGTLGRLRGLWRAARVRISQTHLARRADGVFIVGEGLRPLVEGVNRNVWVGTASWIRLADLGRPRGPAAVEPGGPLRLAAAARLEPMKGLHLAIEAVARLAGPRGALLDGRPVHLSIAGEGPQRPALEAQARALGLAAVVTFAGSLPYGEPFFGWLRGFDLVLLTNLGDEQPRLVFDAISQGVVPVCPDTLPYRHLGLPSALLYARNDAAALAACIERLSTAEARDAHATALAALAREATIESMHARRADWIRRTVLGRGRADW